MQRKYFKYKYKLSRKLLEEITGNIVFNKSELFLKNKKKKFSNLSKIILRRYKNQYFSGNKKYQFFDYSKGHLFNEYKNFLRETKQNYFENRNKSSLFLKGYYSGGFGDHDLLRINKYF